MTLHNNNNIVIIDLILTLVKIVNNFIFSKHNEPCFLPVAHGLQMKGTKFQSLYSIINFISTRTSYTCQVAYLCWKYEL